MKIAITLVVFAAIVSSSLFAQTFRALSTIRNAMVAGSSYSFEIWSRNDNPSTSFFVGISDFYFTYNSAALNNPTISNINPKYTGIAGVNNYSPMEVGIVGSYLQVGIRYTGAAGGSSELVTTDPYGELICKVNMNIINTSQTVQLNWDPVNSTVLTTGSVAVFQTLNGSGEVTGVKEIPLPNEFALSQNYPNPFNPITKIEFALPKQSHVKLDVYNLLGQRIATLLDEIKAAGYHAIEFGVNGYSSGLYFYRMTANGNVTFVKKMVLLR